MMSEQLERKVVEIRGEKRYCVLGPRMGVDFHFTDLGGSIGVIAGLEMHYRECPSYMHDRAPDFDKCWLTDAPCWCDGTSLYATEWLYPLFDRRDPDTFWPVLENEYRRRVRDAFTEPED